jgi:hypothetical protein
MRRARPPRTVAWMLLNRACPQRCVPGEQAGGMQRNRKATDRQHRHRESRHEEDQEDRIFASCSDYHGGRSHAGARVQVAIVGSRRCCDAVLQPFASGSRTRVLRNRARRTACRGRRSSTAGGTSYLGLGARRPDCSGSPPLFRALWRAVVAAHRCHSSALFGKLAKRPGWAGRIEIGPAALLPTPSGSLNSSTASVMQNARGVALAVRRDVNRHQNA